MRPATRPVMIAAVAAALLLPAHAAVAAPSGPTSPAEPSPAAAASPTGAASSSAQPSLPVVPALRETPTAFDDDAGGDADADDPAIWVNRAHPSRSLVVGALKNGGLAVYDLQARLVQRLDVPPAPGEDAEEGRFNNVDIAVGVFDGRRRVDLAVVSDRGRDRVRTYRIDPRGSAAGAAALTDVTAPGVAPVFSADEAEVEDQRTAYGLAATVDARGVGFVATSRRHETELALLRLRPAGGGRFGYSRVDSVELPSTFELPDGTSWSPCEDPGEGPQIEGMVIDADNGVLYAAQEDVGIWRIGLGSGVAPRFAGTRLVDRVREYGVPATFDPVTEECAVSGADPGFGGTHLSADAEGLTIARHGTRGGYLLASSQGDSTFAAYRRTGSNAYLGGFVIGDGPGAGGGPKAAESATAAKPVDGAQHSDGAAVVTTSLGPGYPGGLLVVHDGEETPAVLGPDGEPRTGTDFTFTPWPAVADVLPAF